MEGQSTHKKISHARGNDLKIIDSSKLNKTSETWGSSVIMFENKSSQVEIGLFSVDARKSMAMHEHEDEDELIFVLDGEAYFAVEEKEVKLGKGSAILIPKQVQHRAFNNNEKTCLCLYIVSPLE